MFSLRPSHSASTPKFDHGALSAMAVRHIGDAMKIQLLTALAQMVNGSIVVHAPGDIVELDAAEAQALIEQGSAVAVDEPKPKKKVI